LHDTAKSAVPLCAIDAIGAPAWLHLNRVMAIALGERLASEVRLELYRIA
jgi:hypothetical protein